MAATNPTLTFAAAFKLFCEQNDQCNPFTAGCHAFLTYDQTEESWCRLIILYILYALYADTSLERNPFLTFFLEFVTDNAQRGDVLEKRFVNCILDGSITSVDKVTPKQLCDNAGESLSAAPDRPRLVELEKSVARLMNDPWKEKDNDNTGQVITLLHEACTRTLTIPEQQMIQKALASPQAQTVMDTCQLEPNQLAELLNNNHLMALKVVQAFVKQPNGKEYLQALATVPVSSNCIEVMHLLTLEGYINDDFFLHIYISNIIRSAEMMPEGPRKDTHVRMVARFIQSLLDKKIIQIADYMIEIQSFCVGHFRFKGVADLYRLASAEAQRIGIEPIESSR